MERKIVIFPHSDEEFPHEDDLRNWLVSDLKLSEGKYRLKEAIGLGQLEKGCIVFFKKNNYIVGMAVVEEDLRPIKESENEENKYQNIIKFHPGSIWAFSNDEYIAVSKVEKITGKGSSRGYPQVDDASQLLSILAEINNKSD